MPADVQLDVQITKKGEGDKEAALGLKAVGRAADDAADELARLDRKLAETKLLAASAGKEFLKTGDASPLKSLLRDERQLNQVRKSLTAVDDDLERLGKTGLKAGELFQGVFTDLSGTLAGAAKSLASAPELLAVGGAIAVPLAAGLSAALSGAALAGTAGAGLAAGILLAGRSSEVHAAWTIVANDALKGFSNAASSFQEPLVRAAKTFDDALAGDLPRIRRDFEILAPLIDDLAKGAAGLFHNLQPGLQDAFRGAVPVVKELSAELPKLGDDVSFLLSQLGGSGRAGAEALGLTLDGLGASLRVVGIGLHEGSDLFEIFGTGALGAAAQLGVLDQTVSALTQGPGLLLYDWLTGNANKSDEFSKSVEELKNDMADASAEKAFQEGMATAAAALREGQAAAQDMEHQVSNLARTLLASKDADIAFKQGHLDLVEALKAANGHIDQTTESSLRAQKALLSQAQGAIAVRDSVLAQTGSVELADKAFQDHIAQIYADAAANGVAKGKVDDLIGSLNTIPKPDPVDIELKRQGYSDDDLRELKRGLLTMPSADPHIDLRRQGYSDDDIRELGREVNGLPSYHPINVEVIYSTTGSAGTASGRIGNIRPVAHGDIIGAARGMVASSAPTVVFGERTLPEAYIPAPNSGISQGRADGLLGTVAAWWGRRLMPASGGGGTVINLTVNAGMGADGRAVGRQILDMLRSEIKSRGGNVQMILAGKAAQ
jgi:hypothetical protein